MARLDNTAQQAALDQAEAQVKAADALRAQTRRSSSRRDAIWSATRNSSDATRCRARRAEQAQTQVDTLVAQVTAQERQQ